MTINTNASIEYPRAVLFDLLTGLLDSWTVWNAAAGSETKGRAWRAEYLRLTYGCGAYQPYEQLVRLAANNTMMDSGAVRLATINLTHALTRWHSTGLG